MRTADIRNLFAELYIGDDAPTVEILGASFEADEAAIFGTPDEDYIKREYEWYALQSRTVDNFPGGAPTIWRQISGAGGHINSNYGWCIWSGENYYQYNHVLQELKTNPQSRRASMIYTRPTMHRDAFWEGAQDFICTNAVTYYIRNNELHAVVQMRSNDAVYGYKNDRAWQLHVQEQLAADLNIPVGKLFWQVQNLHVYSRHYKLIEEYKECKNL
jgi:thymidylate synthase